MMSGLLMAFACLPDGIGSSRLKVHAVRTGRNWNTVLKLAALVKR